MKTKQKKKYLQQYQKFQQEEKEKGLFTFYREQAQYQEKIALQKKINKLRKKLNKQKQDNQFIEIGAESRKNQNNYQRSFSILSSMDKDKDNMKNVSNQLLAQQELNHNYSGKQIQNRQKFGMLVKTHRKGLNYVIIDDDRVTPSKQQRIQQRFGESVIIIKKKQTQQSQLQRSKQEQKIHKNYSYQHAYKANRYGSQKGHYIKKKEVNLFGNFKNENEECQGQGNNDYGIKQKQIQNQQGNQFSKDIQKKGKDLKDIDLLSSNSQKYLRLKLEKQKGLIKLKHYQRSNQVRNNSTRNTTNQNSYSNKQNYENSIQKQKEKQKQKELKDQNLNNNQKLDKSFQKNAKRVQNFPQIKLPSISNYNSTEKMKGSKHLSHNNKMFSSMLKSTDTELVKQIRKALQVQRQDKNVFNNLQNQQQNSLNFMIQYNKYSAEESSFQLKSNNLNEKQKRLLNILNQFRKVHD